MNIYLVHTFFYLILWRDYIYWFRYPALILLALLITSLAYSVVLECLKKALGFYRLLDRVQYRRDAWQRDRFGKSCREEGSLGKWQEHTSV